MRKDFCLQNNQLYLCVLSIIRRPSGRMAYSANVFLAGLKLSIIRRPSGRMAYSANTKIWADSWPSLPRWKIPRSTPPLFLNDVQKRTKSPLPAAHSARQITENALQMPRYVPAGGAGVYIDWCITLLWKWWIDEEPSLINSFRELLYVHHPRTEISGLDHRCSSDWATRPDGRQDGGIRGKIDFCWFLLQLMILLFCGVLDDDRVIASHIPLLLRDVTTFVVYWNELWKFLQWYRLNYLFNSHVAAFQQ